MHVERYGHGTSAVVLLHGFPTCSFLWRDVGVRLARRRHVVYAPDLFGYGESDRPFDVDFGVAAQAEYLDRALTQLRVQSATVVGVDLGGTVALRLAATRPERVRRMALINAGAFNELPGRDVRALERLAVRHSLRIARSVTGAAPLVNELLERSVVDAAEFMPPRLMGRYLAPFVGQEGVAHLYALARSIRSSEVEEILLDEVTAPTLVVRSQLDTWLDESVAERLVDALPHAQLLRVPSAARLLPEERPELVAEFIHDLAEGRLLPLEEDDVPNESPADLQGVEGEIL